MKELIEVERCIHGCPFFQTSMDGMECGHPYWDSKGPYENLIINTGDIIPNKCPLRQGPMVQEIRLK